MKPLLTVIIAASSVSFSQPVIPSDREGLLKGEGMGFASFAEMNRYPGPKHVLEFKEQLGLTQDQILKTEAILKGVEISAKQTGQEIVEREEELNKLFETGRVNEKTLRSRLETISRLRGQLRFIHMQAHVKMKGILSENQIQKYVELRGYAGH